MSIGVRVYLPKETTFKEISMYIFFIFLFVERELTREREEQTVRGRERILGRLLAQPGAQGRALSHHSEIIT